MIRKFEEEYRSFTLANIRELIYKSKDYTVPSKEVIYRFFKENEKEIIDILKCKL